MKNGKYDFDDLLDIMKKLRSPEGCPWDKEQTHDSLRIYLLEETYEVLEALATGDRMKFCNELGDLLLQIVFHAQIAEESGRFDIKDVTNEICTKLISRHPHIFEEVKADTPEQVICNWETIKKKEKKLGSHTEVLRDVPSILPGLMRSFKVQQKAALAGFDWEDIDDVFKKVDEEIGELKEAYKTGDAAQITDELGDAIFALVNLSRFLNVQPELALTGTVEKFIERFDFVEGQSQKAGKKLEDMSLEEMDVFWNKAKETSG